MVTKGIIQTLDLLGNTCTVRMPLFETSGNDEITGTATISNTPGSYNGYRVGDVVWIAFEDGQMNTPVVIGKLYLGAEAERNDPRGIINVESSTVTKNATVPADTKLAAQIDNNVPNTTVPYSSLSSIANNLNTLNVNVAQNDRDYGNRFKQVISNADDLRTSLEQTASNMVAKASGFQQNANGEFILDDKGNKIPEEFGWELQSDKWTVFSQDGEILKADQYGLTIKGEIKAESGHIGSFEIGKTHDCPILGVNGNPTSETIVASGIYSTNYIKMFEEDAIGKEGVYIGTDGIKLGPNFSVNTNGEVIATNTTITGNITANTLTISDGATINGKITSDNIDVAGLNTDGIKVVKKIKKDDGSWVKVDANGNEIADDNTEDEIIVFNANASSGDVQIGGFTVNDTSLSSTSGNNAVIVSPGGISLGASGAFSVNPAGEIAATNGTFLGTIESSGAILTDIETLRMGAGTNAEFATITSLGIAADDIIAKNGYYFGEGAGCGFKLDSGGTTEQDFELTISSNCVSIGNGTSTRYSVTVTSDVPMASDTTIGINDVTWGTGTAAVTISGNLIIKAGSKSASKFTTRVAKDRFDIIKYTQIISTYDLTQTAASQNPTGDSNSPEIRSVSGTAVRSYNKTTKKGKQKVTSSSNKILLTCDNFEMNGKITVPSTGSFQVGEDNNNVILINQAGIEAKGNINAANFKTDGKVEFKVGSKHYEPAIRLGTDGSPNCFWSKAFEIGGEGGSGWKSVTLPGELQDSSGSSGNNSKIIAVLATGKFPKDVDKKDPNSGDAQGATFYTWWDGTKAYVYNPISKAPSDFVINIVVLGKI